ncbi:MAG: hypothetical protein H6508_07110 [Calditrichaeota bacterium]|nr:hypothetical protein [Calditrichota bacterium]MCB9366928.1 hypothetical protein [Calditrichota bacterium]
MMTKRYLQIAFLIWAAFGVLSCDDPRTPPLTGSEPSNTETVVLWESAASDGSILSAQFEVKRPLSPINFPGVDQPARLNIAAYFRPDADVMLYEQIVNETLPSYDDQIIGYLVGIESAQGILDSVAAVRALCDTLPSECPDDTSGLIPAENAAQPVLAAYQDSLDAAIADTTALGVERDSLGRVLDDRFTLSLWFDDDSTSAYPEALLQEDGRLGGQGLYLAETHAQTGLKGRGFQMDLARFSAADLNLPMRPLEFNWTTCFPGSERPCMSVGTHTLRARVTGAESYITAAVVFVYAEE